MTDDWKDCDQCDSPHEHKQHLLINKLNERIKWLNEVVLRKDNVIGVLMAQRNKLLSSLYDRPDAFKSLTSAIQKLDEELNGAN